MEKRINNDGYVMVRDNDGILNKPGYFVLEHRLIMSKALGYPIPEYLHVHHINGNKKDNRLDNLALVTMNGHAQIHATTITKTKVVKQVIDPDFFGKQKWLKMRCPNCGKKFFKPLSASFLKQDNALHVNFCCVDCSADFQKKIDTYRGITPSIQSAIDSCVICQFTANGAFMRKFINGKYKGFDIDDNGNYIKCGY